MSNIVKVGIAGLGRSGWNLHADALSRLPEHYTVAAAMDLSEQRRSEANTRFGCPTFGVFADLANADVDLIVVATPSPFHAEHAIAALQAGKHVLVEKPLASSVAEVDAMISAARAADKVLTVGQNYRYHGDFRTISEVMASGKLGGIVQIRVAVHQFSRRWDWQTLRANNGGIMTNHGAHVLDWLLLHLEDDDPEVFCHLVNTPLYAGDADSHAKIIIRPRYGPLLDIELTHSNAYPQANYTVMGTQGSLSGTRQNLRWKYFVPGNERVLELDTTPTADRSYNREDLTFTEESAVLTDTFSGGWLQLYRDLYGTLRENEPLKITPESVRKQIYIFSKCRASANWSVHGAS